MNHYELMLKKSKEYRKVMTHVNKDYHMAFKEWLVNKTDEFRPNN